jgi:HlyD family secretion protein
VGKRSAAIGAVLCAAIAIGVVWASTRGSATKAPAGEVVVAERGEVAVTVGGVGHVSTLAGAARLAVPSTPPAATGSSTTATAGATATATAGNGPSTAPADAVFPAVTGHVTDLLVHPGDTVVAGQPIARLADDGTLATAVLQARSDLATARLELAQKRIQDPARGQPPTQAEMIAGHQAVTTARLKLHEVLGPPVAADVAAARLDVAKSVADLRAAQGGAPAAVNAAELAVATAQQRLKALTGAPSPADVAAAQLDLAKASVDQESLLQAPSPVAVGAADAAIAAAQQKLSDAQAGGTPADAATARAELAKAQADRDALAPPSGTARSAAQLAVDAARLKLADVTHPPPAVVAAAREELARARADLATQRSTRGRAGLAAARAGVAAAQRKLAQVLGPPLPGVVPSARLDLRKAQADLAVLRQRGAPASATDLALARLKLDVAAQRLSLERQLDARLTVRSNATGTVTSVLTGPGAAVDATTPIARVQDLHHLVVALDLSEFDVGRIRVGAPARISAEALGGAQFGGRVVDIALSGNETGGVVNYPVTIALNRPGRLRPAMSVSTRIVVARNAGVVRIPLAAVDRAGRPSVLVRTGPGRFARRPVTLGLAGAEFVEVRSGLRAGERVLVPTRGA